ncbi:MAG TPA: DUF1080 domain-containing protein [Thermoguttaceae bacterium]|nr:DUF1080 domain-containing protein [Thermoguttaceae bacterium]
MTREEEGEGFQLLFDGKSMDGWRNFKSETIRPEWKVEDGAMVLSAKGGGDLVTREAFGHFELRLEYSIGELGNSGIMFRVVEDPAEKLPWRLAPEFQLYDSFNVKVSGDRSAGALYGLVAAPQDLAKPPGQWNQVRILLEPAGDGRDRLRCWLNGTRTVDLVVDHSPDSEWSKLIGQHNLGKAGTKYELPGGFFRAETGPILLQDHGARTAFRTIRIRELEAPEPEINRRLRRG